MVDSDVSLYIGHDDFVYVPLPGCVRLEEQDSISDSSVTTGHPVSTCRF